jgi:hypothetical protein
MLQGETLQILFDEYKYSFCPEYSGLLIHLFVQGGESHPDIGKTFHRDSK